MTNLTEILAAIESLPVDERVMLTHRLAFGVKPVEPVPVTIEEDDETGGYRVVLPDGTAIEGCGADVIFEIDSDVRRNYVEPSPHGPTLRVYQDDDSCYETATWAVEVDGEVIPVTLPDGWEVVWY